MTPAQYSGVKVLLKTDILKMKASAKQLSVVIVCPLFYYDNSYSYNAECDVNTTFAVMMTNIRFLTFVTKVRMSTGSEQGNVCLFKSRQA